MTCYTLEEKTEERRDERKQGLRDSTIHFKNVFYFIRRASVGVCRSRSDTGAGV